MVPIPEYGPALRRKATATLVGSQVLGGIGVAIGLSVGTLLAAEITGSAAIAGFSQSVWMVGAAIAGLPLARLAVRRGRRPSLVLGYALGGAGALGIAVSARLESLPLLLVGYLMFGMASASNLQARYAAADLAEEQGKGRAISLVVAATTIGAVLGPFLLGPTGRAAAAIGWPELAGPFLWAAVGALLSIAVLWVFLRPDPLTVSRAGAGRPAAPTAPLRTVFAAALRSAPAAGALAGFAGAHGVMIAVMSFAPLHMSGHGAGLTAVGVAMSMHLVGMYALAPVMGWLTDRFGHVPVLVGGQAVLVVSSAACALISEGGVVAMTIALTGLGLGWSASLVAGSALLTVSVAEDVKTQVEGMSDTVLNTAGVLGGVLGGLVVAGAGYAVLSWGAALVAAVVAVAVGLAVPRGRRRSARAAAEPAGSAES